MIHVFTGPTLAPGDPALADARIRILPPARHGDLFDNAIAGTDTVVVIDGAYMQAPALRHKEIIWALSRGVRVIGAASIGALRAAELASCGMIGVGEVFAAYARGRIEGDDEVAVAESVDADRRALSWPLVNVRHVLRLAERESVIDAAGAREVFARLASVYYAHRSLTAVLRVSRTAGAHDFARWLTGHLEEDPYFGNVKRTDALAAVEMALRLHDTVPAVPRADLVWKTRCFRQWANRFAAQTVNGVRIPTRERVAYQQVFDPDFPRLWWRCLHPEDASEVPSAFACALGRPEVDLTDPTTVARLLAHETPADVEAVTRYRALNQNPGRLGRRLRPETIKDDVARQVLSAAWSLPPTSLADECWRRGFHGEREAVAAVKPFVLGVLLDKERSS
ncbi:TfuA-like protein [Streptomyces sp. NPDC020412]|uniref:TfuA-like protein n=1 Tax=Streptomyces sp. NPDC020412 TaxID=3365073 RepID=UPI0037B7A512